MSSLDVAVLYYLCLESHHGMNNELRENLNIEWTMSRVCGGWACFCPSSTEGNKSIKTDFLFLRKTRCLDIRIRLAVFHLLCRIL